MTTRTEIGLQWRVFSLLSPTSVLAPVDRDPIVDGSASHSRYTSNFFYPFRILLIISSYVTDLPSENFTPQTSGF